MSRTWWLPFVLLTACGSPGNTGRPTPSEALISAVPWTNGTPPLRTAEGAVLLPTEPIYPPIASNIPDPGSRTPSCDAFARVEPSPFWMERFEPALPGEDSVGVALAWSAYDDQTAGAFHMPGNVDWYRGLGGRFRAQWGLAAQRHENGPSCDGLPNNWSLHYRGGHFKYFGGGLAHPLAEFGCPANSDLCPPPVPPGATVDQVGLPTTARDGSPYLQNHAYWNLRAYDGIAFWARRGPEGQPSLNVVLQNKYTSSELARENDTFCRRIRPCRTRCANGSPCSLDENDNVYRCFDPAAGPAVISTDDDRASFNRDNTLVEQLFPRCGASACTSPSNYLDRDFDTTECKALSLTGSEAGEYCFGEQEPPSTDERCGDGFAASVRLTTDWQFFTVPFSSLRQGGFGKRAPVLDLNSVAEIGFSFPVGWVDTYIDDVTFYRRRD